MGLIALVIVIAVIVTLGKLGGGGGKRSGLQGNGFGGLSPGYGGGW